MPNLHLSVTESEADTLARWQRHMVTCRRCVRASGAVMAMGGCASGHYLSTRAAVILARSMRLSGLTLPTPEAGDGS